MNLETTYAITFLLGMLERLTEQQLTHSEKGSPTKASAYPSHKAFMCLYRSDTFSSSQVPNFNLWENIKHFREL